MIDMKTIFLSFLVILFSFNTSKAAEIPGAWNDFVLGMSFKKAKDLLEKKCNKINKSHGRTGYNCVDWEGVKVDKIHLSDEGLTFFKKLSWIALTFNERTDFISFHNKLSKKWKVSQEPYCNEFKKRAKKNDEMLSITDRVKVPFHTSNLSNVSGSCMAWYSKNLILLKFRPPGRDFSGITIEYRNPN